MLQEFTVTQAKSQLLAEGVQFQLVNAHVAAINAHGFIAANNEDMSDFIFVNTRVRPYFQVNYVVTLTGTKKMMGDIPVIENVSGLKTVSNWSDNRWPATTMAFPGYVLDKINLKSADFCKVSGRVEKSGEHYFVKVYNNPSSCCDYKRLVNIDDPLFQTIERIEDEYKSMDDYVGHFVDLYGFWNGVTTIGNRECVNIVAKKISDLAMYDTPSGMMRTCDQPMFVKNAVIAATAHSSGHTSQIVLWDPEKGGQVRLHYSPDEKNAEVLVNCKVGDSFDVIYCNVYHEVAGDDGSWEMRLLLYDGYYEGYTPGNIVPTHIDYGPFTNSSEFKNRYSSPVYFSVVGTVNPNSDWLRLSDGYRINDYHHGALSVLYGNENRAVIASGYFLYHCSDRSYCIFDKVEPYDQAGSMTIQDIRNQKEGTPVKTGPVTVSSFTADGFTVWEGGSDGKGIYVDLSGMPAGQLKSYKLRIGDRVIVSGVRDNLVDPTGQRFIFFNGPCIGGNKVTVSKKGTDPTFYQNWKCQEIDWPKDYDDACRLLFRGRLVKSGEFYQIEYNEVPSQYIRIYKPDEELKEILENYVGMYVVVDGCYLGYTGSMTLESPRYWYWTIYSVYPDFSSIYSIADANSGVPLRNERVKVNNQPGVPVTIFNKGAVGVFKLPAKRSTASLYAVSNKKVSFHFGGSVRELPASDTRKGLTVDGSNIIKMNWTERDEDFPVLFSWKSQEEEQEDIDVYIFGIR